MMKKTEMNIMMLMIVVMLAQNDDYYESNDWDDMDNKNTV